jgi:hypothetical protein
MSSQIPSKFVGESISTRSAGLAAARGTEGSDEELGTTLQRLAPRWFVVRNAHARNIAADLDATAVRDVRDARGDDARGDSRGAGGERWGGGSRTLASVAKDGSTPSSVDPWVSKGPGRAATQAN